MKKNLPLGVKILGSLYLLQGIIMIIDRGIKYLQDFSTIYLLATCIGILLCWGGLGILNLKELFSKLTC